MGNGCFPMMGSSIPTGGESLVLQLFQLILKLFIVLNFLYIAYFVFGKLYNYVKFLIEKIQSSYRKMRCAKKCAMKKARAASRENVCNYETSDAESEEAVPRKSACDMKVLRKSVCSLFRKEEDNDICSRARSKAAHSKSPCHSRPPTSAKRSTEKINVDCNVCEKNMKRCRSCAKCGKHMNNRAKKCRT
ncbi:hypothetical protein M8J77_013797 [Diaphorina citri]|jgi:hypothetical protein|nr:hypothetical protein M8J77_013797 [Diaphorina citri]